MSQAKQGKMEEMTPGQAATLARNEQVIDTATDNLEELEEELNNSIAETLKGKKRNNPETDITRYASARHYLNSNSWSRKEESLIGRFKEKKKGMSALSYIHDVNLWIQEATEGG